MGDVKNTKYDHLLDFFEVNSSPSPQKDQLNDETENNYPKLLLPDSNIDNIIYSRLQKDEEKDLFSPEKINKALQAPDEEDVITDFLLSVSSSFSETKSNGELDQFPEINVSEAENERNLMTAISSDFCAENLNSDCNLYLSEEKGSPEKTETVGVNRVLIDTAAPFESVKAAVSKFGGILDWKAHRVQTIERRKLIEQELGQARKEIPIYKTQYEEAESSKLNILKELDTTKRLIEELKLDLERAHTEEQQAKQDDELANLRVRELEQGIQDEASIAAKAQLEVARSRHISANSEIKIIKNELDQLRKDYDLLVLERERAVKKAEISVSASKEAERLVEEMMIEVIDIKEALEFAHGAHLQAEEERIGTGEERERESVKCERDLKEVEERRESLRRKILSKKDRKMKLDRDVAALVELKSELAAYVETKLESDNKKEGIKKELEEVKGEIGKVLVEVNDLKILEAPLMLDIEREKSEICGVRESEEKRGAFVVMLEGKMREIREEIFSLRTKERERRERMVELPVQLQLAGQELDQAKMVAKSACEEWEMQKNEMDKAKVEAKDIANKLLESEKEIEAAKASEKLAFSAIAASKKSENEGEIDKEKEKDIITLSLEEYYVLTKKAHRAQEKANATVASVNSKIEMLKESEAKLLRKLTEADSEMVAQKEALVFAIHKAENAKEAKICAEQELRILRAVNEKRRKEYVQESRNPRLNFENSNISNSFIEMAHTVLPKNGYHGNNVDSNVEANGAKGAKKNKKKLFPRFFMFLAGRKAHASKSN